MTDRAVSPPRFFASALARPILRGGLFYTAMGAKGLKQIAHSIKSIPPFLLFSTKLTYLIRYNKQTESE